ncbi:hypothetical protein D3C80_2109290 [compost metagenome]
MIDGGDDAFGVAQGWCHGPAPGAVVADAQHAGVAAEVVVYLGDGVVEAQAVAQAADVGGAAGEEQPAG